MFDTPTVQVLDLESNQIGNAGVTALANACASGSLAQLTVSSHLTDPFPARQSLVRTLSRLTRVVHRARHSLYRSYPLTKTRSATRA